MRMCKHIGVFQVRTAPRPLSRRWWVHAGAADLEGRLLQEGRPETASEGRSRRALVTLRTVLQERWEAPGGFLVSK